MVKRTDFIPSEENLKGPTVAEVLAATKHIPLSRTSQATANFNVGMLQTDVILWTLSDNVAYSDLNIPSSYSKIFGESLFR